MPDYHPPLLPGEKYHILSRAVGEEQLFRNDDNYSFFLSRYEHHISPVADTYAYCLLPNHFHFLLSIKSQTDLGSYFQTTKANVNILEEQLPQYIMGKFSNLLNGYAKAYNKRYNRKGSLFIDFLRRVQIVNEDQFCATVFYIHKNPVHHGYCTGMEDWQWSSYKAMISTAPTRLQRDNLLNWFGGNKGFKEYHDQPIYLKNTASIE